MSLSGRRVFIVEDNSQNRIVYQIMLVRHGVRAEFDLWGRETLAKMKSLKRFDLIILDLMLPNGESGYEIFKKIRADPDFDGVPILAVSASEPSVAIPKTQEMGFAGFIAKPIDDDLFPDQLARVMAGECIWYTG